MRDHPDSAALLAIVGETLRTEVIPHLTGAPAYQARIAASLVAIVARAVQSGPDDDRAEIARLRALLLREDGSLHDLTADLAARLQDGRLTLDQPAVADHLWATTLAKVAIDQPGFVRYRQMIASSDDC